MASKNWRIFDEFVNCAFVYSKSSSKLSDELRKKKEKIQLENKSKFLSDSISCAYECLLWY